MTLLRIFINTSDISSMYGVSMRKAQYLLKEVADKVQEKTKTRRQVTFYEYCDYYKIRLDDMASAIPHIKSIQQYQSNT
jgi:hypothetical protein